MSQLEISGSKNVTGVAGIDRIADLNNNTSIRVGTLLALTLSVKKLIFACVFLCQSFLLAEQLRVVHYNIKELDVAKLNQGLMNPQVKAATNVIRRLKPDFLSINEIQYDLKGVPSYLSKTVGKNMNRLNALLGFNWQESYIGFAPANTGLLAKKIPNTNEYTTDTKNNELADPVNFGVFPAEYSSGGLTQFPILKKVFINKLKWKEFRPERDLSKFKDTNGNPLDAKTVELFDKNFSDLTVKIGEQEVHFILLHTVPAHDFENAGSPNSVRNADQLAFLEWYLTGQTEFMPPADLNITPLPPGSLFVAMGDWNVDVRNEKMPGAAILKRLFKKSNLWMNEDELKFTYESQPFYIPPFQEQLDYIITSKDSRIRIKDGGVYTPVDRQELGCSFKFPPKPTKAGHKVVKYRDIESKKTCYAEVSVDYAEIKTASDHRPLWVDLEISSSPEN